MLMRGDTSEVTIYFCEKEYVILHTKVGIKDFCL